MRHTMKMVSDSIGNESGASAAEHALILGIGGAIGTAINQAGTCISSNGATC